MSAAGKVRCLISFAPEFRPETPASTVRGSISVYESPRDTIYIENIEPVGLGASSSLRAANAASSRGLFSAEAKASAAPSRIGLITSPRAAVVTVTLAPSLSQCTHRLSRARR